EPVRFEFTEFWDVGSLVDCVQHVRLIFIFKHFMDIFYLFYSVKDTKHWIDFVDPRLQLYQKLAIGLFQRTVFKYSSPHCPDKLRCLRCFGLWAIIIELPALSWFKSDGYESSWCRNIRCHGLVDDDILITPKSPNTQQ
ncbi:hypothetical protein, partial [Methylicorpusculum sp.]|uniref:hypothetical protein n=1 Tax=Methylicorpusculum sp. TaxID=2713644 RepID=UPI002AB84EE5